jgi:hypothetical protein
MTSTAREAPTFLMTPAQHRQWAENARLVNRPDLAKTTSSSPVRSRSSRNGSRSGR